MNQRVADVVVTGLGATTPLGGDAVSTWEALLGGESGVAAIEDAWAARLPVRIAARLRVEPAAVVDRMMGRVQLRRLDRCEQLALVAAWEAWADAGPPDVAPERLAVVIGTSTGGVLTTLAQNRTLDRDGARKVSPYTVPMLMPNGPAAWVSIALGARAGAHAPVSACASGGEAIAIGYDLIRAGRADVVVAGGVDACIHPLILAAFGQAKALSTRNDEPCLASRPFDAGRNGFVMGEGAAVLVLARADLAAKQYARVAGYGISSDAGHITASSQDGQVRSMRTALATAGLSPIEIGHVNAHATSTPIGDETEAAAIAEAIGTHPSVTAIKSMTGHLCGGAGALGALSAVLSIRHGLVPATVNLDRLDVKLDVVTGRPRRGPVTAAVVNAFGFGGHNVSLAFTAC